MLYGPLGAGEIMAAVDTLKGAVVATLDAVFDAEESPLLEAGNIVELCLVDTIGPGADDESLHLGVREGSLIQLLQFGQGGMCIGKGLEIGQVNRGFAATLAVEGNAVVNLLEDVFLGRTVAGYKGAVEAVGAATGADGPVAVGTGKSSIDGQFKHWLAKMLH